MKRADLFCRVRVGLAWTVLLLLATPFLAARPRVIVAGHPSQPTSLDPGQAFDTDSSFVTYNVFDTLVRLDPLTFRIEPSLATSWRIENRGLVWVFQLRAGVTFHDGSPCDADAVVFSFQRQLKPKFRHRYYPFPMFAELFPYLKEVRKRGEMEVAFTLSEPHPPFLAALTVENAAIVSPTAVIRYRQDFSRHPVGTGPYQFKEWISGKRLVLVSNPAYWRGRPAIEEYTAIFQPDTQQLEHLFKQEKIDLMLSFSISRMAGLRSLSWVGVEFTPLLTCHFLALNMKRPWIRDVNVRRALNYLWDPRFLSYVFQDYVIPHSSFFPPKLIGLQKVEAGYSYSPEKARQCLAAAGIRQEIRLEFLLPEDGGLMIDLVKLYAHNLKKGGIQLDVRRVSKTEYDRRFQRGEYDLTYSGWIADYPDADNFATPFFSATLEAEGFANFASAPPGPIHELVKKARVEANGGERNRLYREINRRVLAEALFVPLYQDSSVILYNRKIGRLVGNPLGKLSLFDIDRR